jgi:hypothetical protein
MSATPAAIYFSTHHAIAIICKFLHIILFYGLPEAGPARSAIKFGGAAE